MPVKFYTLKKYRISISYKSSKEINANPWTYKTPLFLGYSFYRARGAALLKKWENIPNKLDVLITHTPPLGKSCFF
jgi:hypothetical protein